ncbi:30S ribosome-binding factor RbfA [Nocardioides abyssi]|uniref:Ribosome-binding factor A n=1 Tax=Nocardioides abyssi TaxID=3058370 RepID=A0ABT8ERB5_9ACTN|nr:30S ribosome-binding factor RbfA [Nocardioides abyssi]MDN4160664.1 30S ribosome-binding factor RbfA [Nocardioides abyssi]
MSSPRVRKIADRIQVLVAEMLERRIKDPRLGFVTVTDVRVSGDTQQATIFYTVLAGTGEGAQDDETALAGTAAALESAKGLIRSEVGKQLGMRHVPTLTFVADALPESARHLDEVLARAKALDEEVAARRIEAYAGEPDPYKKPRDAEEEAAEEAAAAADPAAPAEPLDPTDPDEV